MRGTTIIMALMVAVFGVNYNVIAQDYRSNTDTSGVNKPFHRVLSQEGIYFDFIKASTNMMGENFRIPNTVFEIDVLNNNSYSVELKNPMVD